MVRYGMVIDLGRCMGCRACMVACKAENNTPEGFFWMYVFKTDTGNYPNVKRIFLPRPCQHCEAPSCVEACPTQARYKRKEDNIVLTNYSKCIGCRYCVVACPYGVNYFNWKEPKANQYFDWEGREGDDVYGNGGGWTQADGEIPPNRNPDVSSTDKPYAQSRYVGVVEKCTFCVHRIESGVEKGLTPGLDREATPACVIACPVTALHFGDLGDSNSSIVRLLRTRRWLRAMDELGNKPQVYYLF